MGKVGIIVLHYGSLDLTSKCVNSILRHESLFSKIIIVNNTDTLLSSNDIPNRNFIFINNNKNLGFAGGMNIGIKYAIGKKMDGMLILNNDTEIRKPILNKLIKVLESSSSIGIVSPAIQFVRNKKTIFDLGGKINRIFFRTSHDEVESIKHSHLRDVDYVTGAAMLIREEVFRKIGFLDEQFFLYYEDVDFCLRAKEKGFRVVVEPEVNIFHSLSKTVGKVSPFAVYYQIQSALIFGRKHIKYLPNKFLHMIFLVLQTLLITFKYPNVGAAAFKAFFNLPL